MDTIIIIVIVALIIIAIAIAIYFFSSSSNNSSNSNNCDNIFVSNIDKNTTYTLDDIKNLMSLTQPLTPLGTEIEISNKTIPFTLIPNGINDMLPVTYSIVLECYIESYAPTWRSLFSNGKDGSISKDTRRPGVFISGTDFNNTPNIIQFVHGSDSCDNISINSIVAAPLGKWFRIILAINENIISIGIMPDALNPNGLPPYINTKTIKGKFNWPKDLSMWYWNPYIDQYKNDPKYIQGSIKVRSVAFISKGIDLVALMNFEKSSRPK
jgi:hypothetical protein